MNEYNFIGIDYNWFLSDKYGNISILASAGGFIPSFIYEQINMHEKLSLYIMSVPDMCEVKVSTCPNIILEKDANGQTDKYVESFSRFSRKGVFAYDKHDLEDLFDDKYNLVVTPEKKLKIESLPLDFFNFIPKIISLKFDEIDFIESASIVRCVHH